MRLRDTNQTSLPSGDLIDTVSLEGSTGIPAHILDTRAPPPVGYFHEGTAGNDTLFGTSIDDDIFGGGGDDTLYGGYGNDRLYGGADQDTLIGEQGADLLDGGAGGDTVSYAGAWTHVTVDLAHGRGFFGDAEGDTYVSIEHVVGSSFDDVIIGDAGNNILKGNGGDDQIVGGAGQDTLIGGAGQDTLTGDMEGIAEFDTFVFTRGSGVDRITDFQQGVDRIDLTAFGFGADAFGKDGELATGWFGSDGDLHSARGLSEGDRFFFDTHTNTLYECHYLDDADVSDPLGQDFSFLFLTDTIVTLDDNIRLHADDLFV